MALPDAAITLVQLDGTAITSLRIAPGDKPPAQIHYSAEGLLPRPQAPCPDAVSPCIILLPRHEVTLRILTLPSQDTAEIAAMVQFDAAVPY